MYAVVEIQGSQFKVSKNQKLYVNRLKEKEGTKVSFENVLLVDDDGKVNVGGQAGLNALNQMKDIFTGCDMNNYSNADGLAAFNAGKLPMFFWSTSSVGSVEAAKGDDWTLDTEPFPGMPGVNGGTPTSLPAGGNAAMFVSTSDDLSLIHI